MRRLLLAGTALLALLGQAAAGTINLQISQDGGVPTVFPAVPGDSSFSATDETFGSFTFTNISGATNPSVNLPTLLTTNTITVQSADALPHTLDIWVTGSDLTAPLGAVFTQSGFSSSELSNGWSALLETYYSTTNALFGGTLLDNALFAGTVLPTGQSSTENEDANFGAGPLFSISAHYRILTTGLGNANLTITAAALQVVPIPPAMALFGTGLVGLGWLARRRKQKQAAQQVAA